MFGFGEDNDYRQPQEKSFWSKLGDFALNSLIVVAAVLAVVSLTAIFSDTVSNKLDDWTKDKDGKGGWGSAIRKAVGVSTENNTSAGNKLSEMADKAAQKAKELKDSILGGENQTNQPTKSEGISVSDVAAGGALLYGAKKGFNAINRPVNVDADGKVTVIPEHQLNTAKAVELAKEQIEAAKLAEKKAAEKVANLKGSKIMEDEALKKQDILKRINPLRGKPANVEYTKALKLHKQASETLANLKTVITEGEEALAKGLQPNSTRWKEFVKKFSASGSETGSIEATPRKTEQALLEDKTRRYPQSKIPPKSGVIDLPDSPATKPPAVATPETTIPETTIKVGKSGLVEFQEAEKLSLKATVAGEPPSVRGKVGKAGGLLGIAATILSTIRGDFENALEKWNHKDEKGNPDSRGTAVLQGLGTAVEVGSYALIPVTGGYSVAIGTASKEALSMGHEYVTGKPSGITQSLLSGFVEATGAEAKALAKDIYNATGLSDEAKELAKAKARQEHDKAVEQAISRLTPEHKAAFDAWLNKAKELGRNDIDPLVLMEQVKDSNFRPLVPNTPGATTGKEIAK